MVRYLIYADDDDHPGKQIVVRKTKHEYDALNFVSDVKNLSRYGCMTLIKQDDEGSYIWSNENDTWEKTEE